MVFSVHMLVGMVLVIAGVIGNADQVRAESSATEQFQPEKISDTEQPDTAGGFQWIIPLDQSDQIEVGTMDPYSERMYFYSERTGHLFESSPHDFRRIAELDPELIQDTEMQFTVEPYGITFVDRGIGRVFFYDLEGDSLRRLDQSYSFHAYYDFGGYLNSGPTLFTMGGYGEFRFKNTMLTFTPSAREWEEIVGIGDVPEPNDTGYLYRTGTVGLSIFYISYAPEGIKVYSLNNTTKVWTLEGVFDSRFDIKKIGYELNAFSNNKHIGNLLHIRGSLFYDILENEIKIWNRDVDEIIGFFASQLSADSVYLLRTLESGSGDLFSNTLIVEKIPVGQELNEEAFSSLLPRHVILFRWMLGLLIALALGIMLVMYRKNIRMRSGELPYPVTFLADRVEVESKHHKEPIYFYDELDRRFWEFAEMNRNKKVKRVTLEEMDDYLFSTTMNLTQRSNKRMELIRRINSAIEQDFILITRSESDKRRKNIRFNWDVLLFLFVMLLGGLYSPFASAKVSGLEELSEQHLGQKSWLIPLASEISGSQMAINPHTETFYVYNEANGTLYEIQKDGIQVLDTLDANYLGQVVIVYTLGPEGLLFVDGGIGRVHFYDIDTQELKRLDESYPFRAFYGFGGAVGAGPNIYTMGGYGEFRHSNAFLRFNYLEKEWSEVTSLGEPPLDREMGHLFLTNLPSSHQYYVSVLDNQLKAYRHNMATKEWKLMGTFELDLDPNELGASISGFGNYRQIGNMLHIKGNIFYDFKENEVKVWQSGFNNIIGFFATNREADSVLCVHLRPDAAVEINKHDWEVQSFPSSSLLDESNLRVIRPQHILRLAYLFLFVVGSIGLFIVVMIARKPRKLSFPVTSAIQFYSDRVEIQTKYRGEPVVFFDELDLKLWAFVEQARQNKVKRVSLEDLDEALFAGLMNVTQRSVKRKELFKRINERMEQSFLIIERSDSDKRRKIIVFKWDILI
jgi:predicted outer membrane lipoprotein